MLSFTLAYQHVYTHCACSVCDQSHGCAFEAFQSALEMANRNKPFGSRFREQICFLLFLGGGRGGGCFFVFVYVDVMIYDKYKTDSMIEQKVLRHIDAAI